MSGALLVAACGSADAENSSPTTTTSTAAGAAGPTDERAAYVAAKAAALCAVRNQKFSDAQAQEAAYVDALGAADVSDAQVKVFEADRSVRSEISARVAEQCSNP